MRISSQRELVLAGGSEVCAPRPPERRGLQFFPSPQPELPPPERKARGGRSAGTLRAPGRPAPPGRSGGRGAFAVATREPVTRWDVDAAPRRRNTPFMWDVDAAPRRRNTPFMLSRRSRYALRALIHLAQREAAGPASIAEIARLASAPRKFLEAILLDLKHHNLLISSRGRSGGYQLAAPPEAISFADVIRALDGPLALAPCASKTPVRTWRPARSIPPWSPPARPWRPCLRAGPWPERLASLRPFRFPDPVRKLNLSHL